jgi:cytochrome oxidase Cu insertion factor (SCO1/SenC/PrrC family)
LSIRGHRGKGWLRARALLVSSIALVGVLLGAGVGTPAARADGDPASDVLVSQNLYLPADAGASGGQVAQLNAVLRAVKRSGTPVRVAVIPSAYDLGSVDPLWRRPDSYARFLGVELSLIYRQALLIVMPNGFGLNWPGHSTEAADARLAHIRIVSGGRGIVAATEAAVRAVAASEGGAVVPSRSAGADGGTREVAVIAGAVVALLAAGTVLRVASRRRRPGWAAPGMAAACCLAIGTPVLLVSLGGHSRAAAVRPSSAAPVRHSPAPAVRQGPAPAVTITPSARPTLTWRAGRRPAPGSRLTDQNGRSVSIAAYRGRPFIVTFIDPLCRNLCPLAAQVLDQADRQLPASRRLPIIAVSVDIYADTRSNLLLDYRKWQLVPQWRWAVGAPGQLAEVWKRWQVGVWVQAKRIAGTTVHYITHNEFAFLIDRRGDERALFVWPYSAHAIVAELDRLSRT